MKNSLLSLVLVFIFTTLSLSVAQSTGGGGGGGSTTVPTVRPDNLPFGNNLRAWAWNNVAWVSGSAWSSDALRSTNGNSWFQVQYTKPNKVALASEIFSIIKTQTMVLDLLKTNEVIGYYSYLTDTNGYELFNAVNYRTVTLDGGKNLLKIPVSLQLAEYIWLPCGDANWFYFLEEDENGDPVRYYYQHDSYEVQNGRFRFPSYFAGKPGRVVLSFPDGSQKAYGLKDGKAMRTYSLEISGSEVSEIGTRTYTVFGGFPSDTNLVKMKISASESLRNINPLGQMVQIGSGEVRFTGYREFVFEEKGGHLYYEKAIWVHIWAVENSGSTFDQTFKVEGDFKDIPLKMGYYWVEFGWPSGFPNGLNEFNPPYDGGGGKGSPIP